MLKSFLQTTFHLLFHGNFFILSLNEFLSLSFLLFSLTSSSIILLLFIISIDLGEKRIIVLKIIVALTF